MYFIRFTSTVSDHLNSGVKGERVRQTKGRHTVIENIKSLVQQVAHLHLRSWAIQTLMHLQIKGGSYSNVDAHSGGTGP